jgi:hypothetical protein
LIDPLKCGSLEKADRPAHGSTTLRGRQRYRDLPREIEQIGGSGVLQYDVEPRPGVEDRTQTEADDQHHDRESEHDTEEVRQTPPEAEVQPGSHQHQIIRPGCEKGHDAKHRECHEQVHSFHPSLAAATIETWSG